MAVKTELLINGTGLAFFDSALAVGIRKTFSLRHFHSVTLQSKLLQTITPRPTHAMPKPKTLSTVKYYLPVLLKEQEEIHAANKKRRSILFANTFAAILVFLVTLAVINSLGLTQGLNSEIQSLMNR